MCNVELVAAVALCYRRKLSPSCSRPSLLLADSKLDSKSDLHILNELAELNNCVRANKWYDR